MQQPNLAFLDSAATTQRPKVVLDAQRHFYETMNANPLRGLYKLSVEATEVIDKTRKDIAAFIGATDGKGKPQGNEIVFTRNASESLNLVAHTLGKKILKPGDEVVISIMEHHSNLIPWQQICKETGAKLVYLRLDKDFRITP
ncbi:MAG: aminotransferase class V-fold PLP-dependent enzyme, partial [Coriobacteriaceae bacterium]